MAKGRANPTALRTGGGRRLAGQETLAALNRQRNRAGTFGSNLRRAGRAAARIRRRPGPRAR